MPLILAVDTTSEYGSLALVRGGELLEEVALHAPAGFSPVLYGEIAALLERHAVKLRGCRLLRGGLGPGDVHRRAGRAGLREGTGGGDWARPAVAVSNLEALARFGTAPPARRGAGCAPRRDLRRGLR